MGNKKIKQAKILPAKNLETDKDLTAALKHKPYVSTELPFPQKQYEPEADKIKGSTV